jgi:hypothetical protein
MNYNSDSVTQNPSQQLTDRDKAVLDSLVNPDEPQPAKYEWDKHYQQVILGLLAAHQDFLQIGLSLIKPSYFLDRAHQAICEILFGYWRQYETMPSKLTLANEIRERLPGSPNLHYHLAELEACHIAAQGKDISLEYVASKIRTFAAEQRTREAISKTIDKVQGRKMDGMISDWLEQEAAEIRTIETSGHAKPTGLSFDDILAMDIEDYRFIVPGFVVQGVHMLMPGGAKDGKTTYLIDLAICSAGTGKAFGVEFDKVPVVYADFELGHRLFVPPFKAAARGHGLAAGSMPLFKLFSKDGKPSERVPSYLTVAWLDSVTDAFGDQTGIVIIDTFISAFCLKPGLGEHWQNDPGEIKKLLDPITDWCHRTGWTVNTTHHLNKGGAVFGSVQFKGAADSIWELARVLDQEGNQTDQVRIKIQQRAWSVPNQMLTLQTDLDQAGRRTQRYSYEGEEGQARKAKKMNEIAAWVKQFPTNATEGWTQAEIEAFFGMTEDQVRDRIKLARSPKANPRLTWLGTGKKNDPRCFFQEAPQPAA